MLKIIEFLLFFFMAYWVLFIYPHRNAVKTAKTVDATSTPEVVQMATCHFCKIRLPLNESFLFDQRYFCGMEHFNTFDTNGWLGCAKQIRSPNHDERPEDVNVDTVVIHHISLPEGRFGSGAIEQFFTNQLDPQEDPYFEQIAHLEVSAHFLIKRSGELIQFVSIHDRAWHAGASQLFEREKVNDFSVGIEMEGTGDIPYENTQYQTLAKLVQMIEKELHINYFVGHSDISPNRKTDPGKSFDWKYVSQNAKIPENKLPFGSSSR